MSKNVVVNGKTYNGVSFLQLLTTEGASVLFKDMDEADGSLPGFAEMASGTFSVQAETTGSTDPSATKFVRVEHGMSGTPDGYIVFPKYWYDTQDNQLIVAAYMHGESMSRGRRSVESDTHQNNGYADLDLCFDTYFSAYGNAFAAFKPTYIDNEGNEGQQEYIWIAWRLAE